MSFKKNKYLFCKNVLSKELINFCFNYFLLKRDAVNYLYNTKSITPHKLLGSLGDSQVKNSYSIYGDFLFETLLMKVLPVVEKHSKLELVPTYSYARVYEKGDILKEHKDRPSCEISVTLNLGGEQWDFYLDSKNNKEIKVKLSPGDILIYSGCELKHWRKKFEGNICAQVFLHYNDINGPFKIENTYDKRQMLGVPN